MVRQFISEKEIQWYSRRPFPFRISPIAHITFSRARVDGVSNLKNHLLPRDQLRHLQDVLNQSIEPSYEENTPLDQHDICATQDSKAINVMILASKIMNASNNFALLGSSHQMILLAGTSCCDDSRRVCRQIYQVTLLR